MHFDQLDLSNFKCFEQQSVRFSKITVLLGANSSGKSSLLQGILAAVQTDQFPVVLSLNGPYVDLGDFRSLVHNGDKSKKVEIGISLADDKEARKISGTFGSAPRTGTPTLVRAELNDGHLLTEIAFHNRYHGTWRYTPGVSPQADVYASPVAKDVVKSVMDFAAFLATQSSGSMPSQEEVNAFFAAAPETGSFSLSRPKDFGPDPRFFFNYAVLIRAARLLNTIAEIRKSFNYIGAFRLEPQRSYFQSAKGDLRIGRDGINTIDQIALWQETKAPEIHHLESSLRRMRLISGLRTATLRSGLYEVRVRQGRKKIAVALPDVGFGISQLLPILVAELQLPKGGTLAVSQPEIHLHPSAQADYAEHLFRGVQARGMRYVVETHSEYFLNRLRLLIVSGKLSTEDVSVIYISQDAGKSKGHVVRLLQNGRIEGAPRDFFQTYMMDVMNIALSAK